MEERLMYTLIFWLLISPNNYRTFEQFEEGYGMKKSLKIPKGQSETVYRRRTDNTMAKRKSEIRSQKIKVYIKRSSITLNWL
jgi:hypothetical protein